jgi:hypothetical protein
MPERVKAQRFFRTGVLGCVARRRSKARLDEEISELVGEPARFALGVQKRERARMQWLSQIIAHRQAHHVACQLTNGVNFAFLFAREVNRLLARLAEV